MEKNDGEKSEDEALEVMQFKLHLEDKKVYFAGKAQSTNEETLEKKYGGRYGDVKGMFEGVLKEWKGREEELSKAAFGMYEDFRPNVAKGQKGWGRKGELSLENVRKVVAND